VSCRLAWFDIPGLAHQTVHVGLTTGNKVGEVNAVMLVQQLFVTMVGIFEQRGKRCRICFLITLNSFQPMFAFVVPTVALHTAPGVWGRHAQGFVLESRVGLVWCSGFGLGNPVVVETATPHHRGRVVGHGRQC
jgi:hypothetical protein